MAAQDPFGPGQYRPHYIRHGLVRTPTGGQILLRIFAVIAVCLGFAATLVYLLVRITP